MYYLKQGKNPWARVFLTFLAILLQSTLNCCLNLLEEFGSKKDSQKPNKNKKNVREFVLLLDARPHHYTVFSLGAKMESAIDCIGV